MRQRRGSSTLASMKNTSRAANPLVRELALAAALSAAVFSPGLLLAVTQAPATPAITARAGDRAARVEASLFASGKE